MSTAVKFSSKLNEDLYQGIKDLSRESGRDITALLDEAFAEYDDALIELVK